MSNNDRPPRPPMKLPPMTPHGFNEIPPEARPSIDAREIATEPAMQAVRPPSTKQAELPPSWALALIDKVDTLTKTSDGNHRVVMHSLDNLTGRVVVIEKWKLEQESRKYSGQIKRVSENDMAQDAAIGSLVAKVEDLDEKVGSIERKTDAQTLILERLDKIAESPLVKRTAYAIALALLAWLTAKGHG